MYSTLTVAMYTAVEVVVNTVSSSLGIVPRNSGNQPAVCRSPVVADHEVPVAECRYA